MPRFLFALLLLSLLAACTAEAPEPAGGGDDAFQAEAQAALDAYTARYLDLTYESSLAEWASNTRIVEGDTTNAARTRAANEALAAFTGDTATIAMARSFLDRGADLTDLQRRQFEAILYEAANYPQTVPDLVEERIAAEAAQTETLFGFTFTVFGQEVSTNEIDRILRTSDDLDERLAAWEGSKEVGTVLREGLTDLQRLRNQTVQALGYDDFFAYQVSEYGMTTAEMMDLMEQLNREIRPLYRELHTYARYTLAERYGEPVPDQLPAHWLPNRWAQDWGALTTVEGFDLDAALAEKEPAWLVEQAERFFVSLGFEELPESFWTNSSLYPLPPDADYKKNNHASAWHMDLQDDVRCLMSVEPTADWYETTHHELGHIYYYLSYTNPDVPPLLREGANRGFHEAIGSLLGLASLQPRFAETVGLSAGGSPPDSIQVLLKEALNYAVFLPFSAGVMTRFEHDLYAESLPPAQWNDRWWQLVERYQGVVPPGERDPLSIDAATKTHINNDAAQYYDYAVSYVLLFQLHDHIARNLLGEDPRDTNYFGREAIGAFLYELMQPGASRDWRELLEEATGSGLTAEPMLDYFAPLMDWLQQQNEGRTHTLAELGM